MCNLAIFHVCLPANVEISSQIMKSFVSFNLLKDVSLEALGKEDSVISGEQSLEFLGQRATFNYDSFYLLYNMETLGALLLLYILKIFVIICLGCLAKCCKNARGKETVKEY